MIALLACFFLLVILLLAEKPKNQSGYAKKKYVSQCLAFSAEASKTCSKIIELNLAVAMQHNVEALPLPILIHSFPNRSLMCNFASWGSCLPPKFLDAAVSQGLFVLLSFSGNGGRGWQLSADSVRSSDLYITYHDCHFCHSKKLLELGP